MDTSPLLTEFTTTSKPPGSHRERGELNRPRSHTEPLVTSTGQQQMIYLYLGPPLIQHLWNGGATQ